MFFTQKRFAYRNDRNTGHAHAYPIICLGSISAALTGIGSNEEKVKKEGGKSKEGQKKYPAGTA